MIGKGARLPEVVEAMKNTMVYILVPSEEPVRCLPNVLRKQS